MDAEEPEQNKLLMLRGAMDLRKPQQLVITYAPFQECSNEEFLMRYGKMRECLGPHLSQAAFSISEPGC